MVMDEPFTTTNPFIVSFSYADFASGTGFVNYLPFSVEDDAGINYVLDSNVNHSATDQTTDVHTSTGVKIDLDFDIPFNLTQTAKGVALFTIPWYLDGGGARNESGKIKVTLRHFDGVIETDLGTATGITLVGTTGFKEQIAVMKVDITEKVFSDSDILRVNIVAEVTATNGSGNATIAIAHSPKGATVSSLTLSKQEARVPFKINV